MSSATQNFDEVYSGIIAWADAKGILSHSTVYKQLDKTSEEFNELQRAIAEANVYDTLREEWEPTWPLDDIVDAFGDTMVTLIIAAHMMGIDLRKATAVAYEVISKRTGKMVDGKFVKESDLQQE